MSTPYYPNSYDYTGYMQGNCQNPRAYPITKVTPHHAAGVISGKDAVKGICQMWINRQASANYIIDKNGECYLIVPHECRAWTSGSRDNDMRAITIEMSNDSNKYPWTISPKTLETAISLTAYICAKYGITPIYNGDKSGTMTTHRMFQATQCPGDYFVHEWLESGAFVKAVQDKMNGFELDSTPLQETINVKPITHYVQIGAYKRKDNAIKQSTTLEGYAVINGNDGLYRVRKPCTIESVDNELAIAQRLYPKAFKGKYE